MNVFSAKELEAAAYETAVAYLRDQKRRVWIKPYKEGDGTQVDGHWREIAAGRSENGNLRNFGRMSDPKLAETLYEVVREGDDPEALEALMEVARARGVEEAAPAVTPGWTVIPGLPARGMYPNASRSAAILNTNTKINPHKPEKGEYYENDMYGYVVTIDGGQPKLITSHGDFSISAESEWSWRVGERYDVHGDQSSRRLGYALVIGIADFKNRTHTGEVPNRAMPQWVFK